MEQVEYCEKYALVDGVTVGEVGNPVVFTPKYGSIVVDEVTHLFLLQVLKGVNINIESSDHETQKSIMLLMNYEILQKNNFKNLEFDLPQTEKYKQTLTDLAIRKDFRWFSKLLNILGEIIAKRLNVMILIIGILLYLTNLTFWLFFSETNNVSMTWLTQTVLLVILMIPADIMRLVLHEAGHYAAALINGVKPKAGFGLYYNGFVVYVDLTPLDTQSKKNRVIADLAGICMDGFTLSVFSLITFFSHSNIFYAMNVSIVMACFASISLTEKSDLYWALKDLFNCRSITATWATPKLLFESFKHEIKGRKFLAVLAIAYLVSIIISIMVLSHWTLSLVSVTSKMEMSDLIPFFMAILFIIITSVGIHMINKNSTKQN